MSSTAGTYAVIENSSAGNQILVLLDTEADAEAIAMELRRRGLKVVVEQGPS
jgi:hypothetical protein